MTVTRSMGPASATPAGMGPTATQVREGGGGGGVVLLSKCWLCQSDLI